MSDFVNVALAGVIAGGVVYFGEHRFGQPRSRSADAVTTAMYEWLNALQINVNHKNDDRLTSSDAATLDITSAAAIRAAERTMISLGPAPVRRAVLDFKTGSMHMGDPRAQDQLIAVLVAVRQFAVPHLDPVEDSVLREQLFDSPM